MMIIELKRLFFRLRVSPMCRRGRCFDQSPYRPYAGPFETDVLGTKIDNRKYRIYKSLREEKRGRKETRTGIVWSEFNIEIAPPVIYLEVYTVLKYLDIHTFSTILDLFQT